MPFAASNKTVVKAVKSAASRAGRFIQTGRSVDRIPATNARQSARTSTNPAQSVGRLSDSRKVK